MEPSNTGDDQLQLSASSPACPRLPTEVWALIFATYPDGWYHSHRLATVCRQFGEVAAHWNSRVCETSLFDFEQGSSQRVRKERFMEMARRCGNHVKQLVLANEFFLTRPEQRISPNVVVEGFKFMPYLTVLDLRKCYFGQDTTILHAILELEYLQVVRVSLYVRQSIFYDDFTFHFTDEAMKTLVSLAVKTSLQLTCVGFSGPDGDVNELLDRVRAKKGELQCLQVIYEPVEHPHRFLRQHFEEF